MRFKQTEEKYKLIKMGNGEASIHDVGCYLCSLVSGLSDRGFPTTPEAFNITLRLVKAWVGPFENYIDAVNIEKYLPDIFVSYRQQDNISGLSELVRPNLIVVMKVSAQPIGGTGTHFIYLTGVENGVAKIWDPWKGVEELISVRWGSNAALQSLRIFEVKTKPVIVEDVITDQTKIDLGPELGTMEVQAIRSTISDQRKVISSLTGNINSLNGTIEALNKRIYNLENPPVVPTVPETPIPVAVPASTTSPSQISGGSDGKDDIVVVPIGWLTKLAALISAALKKI